jgi:pimeloyl-ACP methyl ester carboxylesterase
MFILPTRRVCQRMCLGGVLLLLTACTGFAPHRTSLGATCHLTAEGKPTGQGCEQAAMEQSAQFDLAVVEFTDQGWLQSRQQLDNALALAQPRGNDAREVQVILFVHGWQHSGGFADRNITMFREVILPSFVQSGTSRGLRTVGIYVSWRGQSIGLRGVNNITFYDRKATAEHVARGSIRELISRLRALHDGSAHVTLIGHSFGGLILYNAIAESLLDSLVRSPQGEPAKAVVDLVLVLNPAFEASRFEPLFQAALLRQEPKSTGRPIFASITSSDDSATGTFFPLGRTINSVFDHEGWVEADLCPDQTSPPEPPRRPWDECKGIARGLRLEKMTNTNTIGHLPRYATHELTQAADHSVVCRALTTSPLADSGAPVNRLNSPLPRNRFPLWTIRTGAEVIEGHSGIYKPELWQFLTRLADPQKNGDALCQ